MIFNLLYPVSSPVSGTQKPLHIYEKNMVCYVMIAMECVDSLKEKMSKKSGETLNLNFLQKYNIPYGVINFI